MSVTKIKFRDLGLEDVNTAPGQFCFEVHYNDHPESFSMLAWNSHVFGESHELNGFFPGFVTFHALYDYGFQAFQLMDFTNPAIEAQVKETTDPERLEWAEAQKKEQLMLKRVLSAPSVPSAIMTKMLVQMVEAQVIDQETAAASLQQNFPQLGERAAEGLIQRGLELMNRQLLR